MTPSGDNCAKRHRADYSTTTLRILLPLSLHHTAPHHHILHSERYHKLPIPHRAQGVTLTRIKSTSDLHQGSDSTHYGLALSTSTECQFDCDFFRIYSSFLARIRFSFDLRLRSNPPHSSIVANQKSRIFRRVEENWNESAVRRFGSSPFLSLISETACLSILRKGRKFTSFAFYWPHLATRGTTLGAVLYSI